MNMNMKKNMVALTVLLALSAHAQADGLKESDNTLTIKGTVVVDGCAFEDGTAAGKDLILALDEVSLASVQASPTDVLATIGGGDSQASLVCPPGINSVDLAMKPTAASYNGDVLLNTKEVVDGGAVGVGFKVKAAFGDDLSAASWIDFAQPEKQSVAVENNKVDIIFGANYALSEDISKAAPGDIEAQLPFTISYM